MDKIDLLQNNNNVEQNMNGVLNPWGVSHVMYDFFIKDQDPKFS